MQHDNPAARLLAILQEGRTIAHDSSCRRAWEKILNVQKGDAAMLARRLGKVMSLPQEIIELTIESYPGRASTWGHWSSQVNSAFFSQNLSSNWQSFIQYIDDHTVNYLQLSADLLESKSRLTKIDQDGLQSIRTTINELVEIVISSEVDNDLKKYVVHHLRAILAAVDEYQITGAIPVLDSIEATIGHAMISAPYYHFLLDTEIGRRVTEGLTSAANLITVAVGIPQIATSLLQLPSV